MLALLPSEYERGRGIPLLPELAGRADLVASRPVSASQGMRKLFAGVFGVLAIGAGVLLGLLGAATLAYGGFIGVFGQGHYPKWLALVVLPVGILFSFTAYGSVRLGLDAFAADGDGEDGADK